MAMLILKDTMNHLFSHYEHSSFYDEMFENRGKVRVPYGTMMQRLAKMGLEELRKLDEVMQEEMVSQGITFTLHNDNPKEASQERTIPFDLLPRMMTQEEWRELDRGLKQRVTALNL